MKSLTEFQQYALSETGKEWTRQVRKLCKQPSFKRLPVGIRIKLDAAMAATVTYALRVPKSLK